MSQPACRNGRDECALSENSFVCLRVCERGGTQKTPTQLKEKHCTCLCMQRRSRQVRNSSLDRQSVCGVGHLLDSLGKPRGRVQESRARESNESVHSWLPPSQAHAEPGIRT